MAVDEGSKCERKRGDVGMIHRSGTRLSGRCDVSALVLVRVAEFTAYTSKVHMSPSFQLESVLSAADTLWCKRSAPLCVRVRAAAKPDKRYGSRSRKLPLTGVQYASMDRVPPLKDRSELP